MKIAMIGSGYVGLTSGPCLAKVGHDVICVDNDASRIDVLNRGEVPIYEPGLPEIIAETVKAGRLRFIYFAAGGNNQRQNVIQNWVVSHCRNVNRFNAQTSNFGNPDGTGGAPGGMGPAGGPGGVRD